MSARRRDFRWAARRGPVRRAGRGRARRVLLRPAVVWPALAVLTFGLARLSAGSPGLVESAYSRGLFPLIGQGLNAVTGWMPMSLAELVGWSLPILGLAWFLATTRRVWIARRGERWRLVGRRAAGFLTALAVVYVAFMGLWGFNYGRRPFADIAGLDVRPAPAEDLAALCASLIDQANALRMEVKETPLGGATGGGPSVPAGIPAGGATGGGPSVPAGIPVGAAVPPGAPAGGVMTLNDSVRETLARAQLGYDRLVAANPMLGRVLGGHYGPPKAVLASRLMCYTGIGGVYFPFTGEANVNVAMPAASIPFTACHEMAHQRGFAREDEASYIGYLACRAHPDADFRYSGALSASLEAMNQLYRYDPELYAELNARYSDAVRRDINAASAFWEAYEGPVARAADRVNDSYLKANGQALGVQSYGRMVDLLLAEFRAGNGE